jgi:hypothetical protein
VWIWRDREGDCHALDHIRNSVGSLGAWFIDRLHLGGIIHALLVIAIVMVLIQVIQGRRK